MAHQETREVINGIQYQGIDESVFYTVDTAPWGGSPSALGHEITDEEDYTASLKSTMMTGTPSAVGDIITCPALSLVEEDKIYRIYVKFTIGGSALSGYFRVKGER